MKRKWRQLDKNRMVTEIKKHTCTISFSWYKRKYWFEIEGPSMSFRSEPEFAKEQAMKTCETHLNKGLKGKMIFKKSVKLACQAN